MEPCPWSGSVAGEPFADAAGVSKLAAVRTTSAQRRTSRCSELIGPVLSFELLRPASRA
jgi:hypothetical protein